jgi:uncharacterized protein (TIGR03083 family)
VTQLDGLRTAYVAQQHNVVEWLAALPSGAWQLRSRLPGWTVRELAFHVTDMTGIVVRALASGPVSERPLTIAEYTAHWPLDATQIAARDRDSAADLTPADILANAQQARADLLDALETVTGDPVVAGRRGPQRLTDLMTTRVDELVVHSLDLRASVPGAPDLPIDRQALGIACRMLAEVLVERAPGRSVEVRVPPYVAVQCVTGPRHTRGTPPNVVETDAVTFVELATGRLPWQAAVADGRVRASGERADISAYLPVLA